MKISNYFILFILLLTSLFVTAQTNSSVKKPLPPQKGVHMTFDHEKINLGKIKKGEIRKFDYVFTNTGTEIIEIDIASGCDCTTLDYPTNKIFPGKKAIVKVSFDSGKKEGNETNTDVDVYLKNLNPKTGQRILKILNFTYEIDH